jgi:hypothetical protein
MSDLTLFAEDIIAVMHAMDEACHATQALRENNGSAEFDLFRLKMLKLHERLEKLKTVLDNESAFAVDELADAFSVMNTGHRLEYRRTPRMDE